MTDDASGGFSNALQNLSYSEIQQILAEMEQALHTHQQWFNKIIRTLVCRLPAEKDDLNVDSHKLCTFGKWYYGSFSKNNDFHPSYRTLGDLHLKMHQQAASFLKIANYNQPISSEDYEPFALALEQMHLEFFSLKVELENLLNVRDPLTGTMKRISMLPLLREQQEIVNRQGFPCSLIMLHIDLFKDNVQHPDSVPDSALSIISNFISKHLRPYDKIFRYDEDDFLLCIPFIENPNATKVVDRLRTGVSKIPISIDEEKAFTAYLSAGIATLDANRPVELSIEKASQAMRMAKAKGNNLTHIYNEEVSSPSK